MSGLWPIIFLALVLKIPVAYSLWLVWWACKAPEVEEEPEADGGGFKRGRQPRPKLPRGPRRGPHGGGAAVEPPPCPPGGRTRVVKPASQPAFARAGSHADRDRSQPRPYGA